MATQLLDAMAADWDPRRYHDTFTEDLRDRIEAKDKGKDIVEEAEPAERRQRRRPHGGARTERRTAKGGRRAK